ncbi:nicotinate-nucleotide pyrophosphorylase [Aspergillus sp. HF37]|nr:nicotinate-nucleotide pyrophosphorylase [Aspergillus sp. HF37]
MAAHGTLAHLLPPTYKSLISSWLQEDCPSFDYGGFVVGDAPAKARLLGKSEGIVAGIPFFSEVFAQLGCQVHWHVREGHSLPKDQITTCATVTGPINALLLGERTALNILARCSGIATKTSSLVSALQNANPSGGGWHGTLAGTRKTTPGFRLVEKYAMLVGGADPHRHDLSAMVMLKDNHIWACANANAAATGAGAQKATDIVDAIPRAVAAAKASAGFSAKVEVEVRSLPEANAAVDAGADVIMLDNFTPAGVRDAARELKRRWKGSGRAFLVEVSGGLNEGNATEFVCEDVDVLSTSSIHQGVGIVDFSLKVEVQ